MNLLSIINENHIQYLFLFFIQNPKSNIQLINSRLYWYKSKGLLYSNSPL